MLLFIRSRFCLSSVAAAAGLIATAMALAADPAEVPSRDVDTDFAAMMAAHHQGAMLRHGRNEQLRRIAQEIIVTQQQEIDTGLQPCRRLPRRVVVA